MFLIFFFHCFDLDLMRDFFFAKTTYKKLLGYVK